MTDVYKEKDVYKELGLKLGDPFKPIGRIGRLMIEVLEKTEGMTKEELAKALGTNTNTIRSLISNSRDNGVRIIDRLVPGNVSWTQKKEYYITEDNQEYYEWAIRQLGDKVKPLQGPPRV